MVALSNFQTDRTLREPNTTGLFRIVGIACIVGFLFDMTILSMPFVPQSIEWRLTFLQQMGERSIVLLFGVALVMLSNLNSRIWAKRISFLSLMAGVIFLLSCMLSLRDTVRLQQVTINRIDNQATELQTRINQEAETNPELQGQVTPEQINQAFQQIGTQAEAAKQNVRTGSVRNGMSTTSNLVVIGVALIGLGRFGMRTRRGV